MRRIEALFDLAPAPAFSRMTAAEVEREVREIPRSGEAPSAPLSLALSVFLITHTSFRFRHLLMRPLCAVAYAFLSVEQRCDYAIALWALTGSPAYPRYVVDVATGARPASAEAQMAAAWASGSLASQCAAWKSAIEGPAC